MDDFETEDDLNDNLNDSQTVTHSQLMFHDDYMSKTNKRWNHSTIILIVFIYIFSDPYGFVYKIIDSRNTTPIGINQLYILSYCT